MCIRDSLEDRPRLEDVASGYWTLSVKQSSGLVSHYGSSPSSSARHSTKVPRVIMLMFDRQRTDWQFAEPRLTSGAFGFLGSIARETSKLRWIATLVGLRLFRTRPILFEDRPRLEDVASGYWTLFIKQSSGLVSHYGSSLSYSARPLGARLLMLY